MNSELHRPGSVLAQGLGADALLLTDVAAVQRRFGTADAEPIGHTTPAELRRLRFPAGSMGPKVEAARRFVERTGGTAAIGALDDASAILAGKAGTCIAPSGGRPGPATLSTRHRHHR